ncbi:hypothetical protein ACFVMC_08000 [Nocardia sp. NPDC127579]|uniref:hypothetical protein n=1 Tax=Nocardia sp. NPDC127579 TaxID=3345402 RepID=UPI003641D645
MMYRNTMYRNIGIAAFALAAPLVLAAPQAAAALPPGVTCDGFTCVNDTDDTYRVTSEVECRAVGMTVADRRTVVVDTYVPPRGSAQVAVACPMLTGPATWEQQPPELGADGTWEHKPPVLVPGQMVGSLPAAVWHRSAVVDNTPRPSSGSAS